MKGIQDSTICFFYIFVADWSAAELYKVTLEDECDMCMESQPGYRNRIKVTIIRKELPTKVMTFSTVQH